MTEIEKLTKRVAELEAELTRLKLEPKQVHEYHYHEYPQPRWIPQPYVVPNWPYLPNGPTWSGGDLQSRSILCGVTASANG